MRLGWQPTRSFDWGYTSEPDEAGVTRALPRGRLLGGCSSTNATFALRGSPADYDGWASSGNPGWSFSDVLPSFTRLERDLDFGDRPWHGSAGPVPIRRYRPGELSDVAAASLAGFAGMGITPVEDHNAPGAVGAGLLPVNCLDGIRLSAAHTYLPRPGDRPNLAIRCDCEVVDLVVERGRALGVRLTGGEIVHAGCVVLSRCPRLAAAPARSGIGPAGASATWESRSAPIWPAWERTSPTTPPWPWRCHTRRNGSAPAPLAQAVATLHSSQAVAGSPPDLQLIAFVPDTPVGAAPATFRVVAALLKPRSRGRISLRSGRATEAPRIDLGTFREPCDLERLEEGLELAEGLAAQPELRLLGKADRAVAGRRVAPTGAIGCAGPAGRTTTPSARVAWAPPRTRQQWSTSAARARDRRFAHRGCVRHARHSVREHAHPDADGRRAARRAVPWMTRRLSAWGRSAARRSCPGRASATRAAADLRQLGREPIEVALEAGRRDHQEVARRLRAVIGESVMRAARREHETCPAAGHG